ncbi:MAG: glycerophosphodiester phosphodiesterase family protein, partial [Melioribacteraceae bacterium]
MKNTKLFILFLLTAILFLSCSSNLTKTSLSNFDEILSKFHNPTSNKILIAAHRAMHTKYPENSLAAFQHSIDFGIDIIETDFRTTKDGKIVLLHDDSVDRTTNGKGKVKDFTFAQLQKMELVKTDGDTNTYRIPLAEDAFNLARGKIIIDLDIKDVSIKDLVNLVHKTNVEKQVLF